jgi:hypothetical protein
MSPTLLDPPIVKAAGKSKQFARRRVLGGLKRSDSFALIGMWGSSCILGLCVLIFTVRTIHWPLAGDASLMHYVVFLMDHGVSPYRDIADVNLPGSYLIDYTVMHTLGGGSLAWRSFDLILMLFSTLAMIAITRPYAWFAGVFAGSLLTVVHGADGIYQLGQRDLVIAVILLVGYAALFRATRHESPRWMLAFGLCAGMATTIKPTFVSLGAMILLWMLSTRKKRREPVRSFIVWGSVGWMIPVLCALVFLWKMRVTPAFIEAAEGIMVYHATLGRKPMGFLLLHSFAPLLPLVCIWICLFPQWKRWGSWEGGALLIGLLHGLLSYVIQGKGYPYQRYPLIALLLLVISIDFTQALKRRRWSCVAGWAGIALGTLFLAPFSVLKASHYDWKNVEFSEMLQGDLNRFGGASLSGHIQCIDSISGCFDVLYKMRLVEADGFIYDEFLFGGEGRQVVTETRRKLWSAIEANPPKLFVVTDDSFPNGPEGFGKLGQWPEFAKYLQEKYVLCAQRTPPNSVRWWSRTQRPHSYRVYCTRTGA